MAPFQKVLKLFQTLETLLLWRLESMQAMTMKFIFHKAQKTSWVTENTFVVYFSTCTYLKDKQNASSD